MSHLAVNLRPLPRADRDDRLRWRVFVWGWSPAQIQHLSVNKQRKWRPTRLGLQRVAKPRREQRHEEEERANGRTMIATRNSLCHHTIATFALPPSRNQLAAISARRLDATSASTRDKQFAAARLLALE